MRTEWPRGKKWTVPARRSADKLHKTLKLSLATGSGEAKPKRQVDRDYSQPGKFRGVRYHAKGRYSAELKVKEVRRWLGVFATAEEAARAFDRAAFEVRGKEARLNFPELIEGAEVHRNRHRSMGLRLDEKREDGHLASDDDGDLDLNRDASTPCGGTDFQQLQRGRSSSPQQLGAMLARGERNEQASDTCFPVEPLQCNNGRWSSGDVAADGHTMVGSETVTRESSGEAPLLPPNSRCVHPHTHPLTARPLLWPDLNADPLDLLPPSLSLSAPEADSVTVRSPSDQPQRPQAATASSAEQQQQQEHLEITKDCTEAGVLQGETLGGMAGNAPDVLQLQSPLAMQQGKSQRTAGTGTVPTVTANCGDSRSSNGRMSASTANAAAASDRLHGGCSTGDLNPVELSNGLPDGCTAKPR